MAFMSANSYLGCALETTRGTAAAGTFTYIPVTTPQVDPMVVFLKDNSFRGSPVDVYDDIPGPWHSEVTIKGYVYTDSIPMLVIGALGHDVVSGTYIHTVKLYNNDPTGSQPQSMTIDYNDGANAWQVAGAQVADLEFMGGADKALEWQSKMVGNIWTTPTPTPTVSTVPFIPGWDTTITVNSSSLTYIADWTCKIDRKAAPIFTSGNQGPHVNFAGPCDVTGSFTYVVDTTADPFAVGGSAYGLYRAATAIPVVILATSPVDSSTLTLTMSNVQFEDPKRTTGKAYTEGTVNFQAKANATDAVSGYAPIQVAVSNSVAAYTPS